MSLDKFKIAMQYAMPKHFISRVVGKLAAAKAGALTTTLIKLFIKLLQLLLFFRFSDLFRENQYRVVHYH